MTREYLIRVFKRKRIVLILFLIFVVNALDILSRNIANPLTDVIILQSAFNENMIAQGNMSSGGILLRWVVTILIALPLSDALIEDFETGLIDIKLTKKNKLNYLKKMYLNNFFYGGIFIAITFIINLMIWLMIRPMWKMHYINAGSLFEYAFLSDIFVKSPLLFFFLNILKFFIIGGIISNFALFINYKFKNKYIGIIFPILLDLIVAIIISPLVRSFGLGEVYGLCQMAMSIYSTFNIPTIIYLLIIIILPLLELKKIANKRDVL